MLPRTATYLDANASAPLSPGVVEAVSRVLGTGLSANPSSIHSLGRRARALTESSREAVAESLGKGFNPESIIFTSSGTEANQSVIRSEFRGATKSHWITSPVEHDSVLQLVGPLQLQGIQVSYLPVDRFGVPQVTALKTLITPETRLVSLILANNETGVLTPIDEIKWAIQKWPAVRFHLDASQAWGKVALDFSEVGAHYLTFSAHKIGALPGVGLVVLGAKTSFSSFILGKQELGRRGGTENVLGIVALGAASKALPSSAHLNQIENLRNQFENKLCQTLSGVKINGQGASRIANTSNISIAGGAGESLVMAMDLAGFCVSAGSACSSGVLEPSHVLMAMGCAREEALGALRVSIPLNDTTDTIQKKLDTLIDALSEVVARIRNSRKAIELRC